LKIIEVIVEAKLNPTEERSKVMRAMRNVVPVEESDFEEVELLGETYLRAKLTGRRALHKIFNQLRQQRTVEAAHKMFFRHKHGDTSRVFFHKQGAYQGSLHFSMEEGESPLGPIMLQITSADIDRVLDWLVPRTEDGHVIEVDYQPD